MPTQNEIAQHLDLSVRSVASLMADEVIKKGATLDATRVAYIRHLREKAAGRAAPMGDGDLDPAQEKAKLARSQRIKIDIETEVLQGKLLPADQVEQEWADLVAAARAKLLGIPPKAASLVLAASSRKEAEAILKGLIWEALDELAKDGGDDEPDEEGQGESLEEVEVTPAPDSEPVGRPRAVSKPRGQRRARKVQ